MKKILLFALLATGTAHALEINITNNTAISIIATCAMQTTISVALLEPHETGTLSLCIPAPAFSNIHFNERAIVVSGFCPMVIGQTLYSVDYNYSGSNMLKLLPNGCHYQP